MTHDKYQIAAVVVTYNRLELLKECISALMRQTRRIDKIYVVNNSSTDGTKEWLKDQKNLFVINQSNIGGSGGFNRGMQKAYDAKYDWIWVMDDDVEPCQDCLAKLLSNVHLSECLQPRRIYQNGINYSWEQKFDLKRNKFVDLKDSSFNNGLEYCFVNVACFEGMLISKNIIEKIGFPDERFFIGYDDTIYGYLASKYTKILYDKNALIIRKKNSFNDLPSDIYLYYIIRNIHLINEYRLRYYKNNCFYLRYNPIIKALGITIKIAFNNKYDIKNKRNRISKVWMGAKDCIQKKTGKSL